MKQKHNARENKSKQRLLSRPKEEMKSWSRRREKHKSKRELRLKNQLN